VTTVEYAAYMAVIDGNKSTLDAGSNHPFETMSISVGSEDSKKWSSCLHGLQDITRIKFIGS